MFQRSRKYDHTEDNDFPVLKDSDVTLTQTYCSIEIFVKDKMDNSSKTTLVWVLIGH